MRRTSSERRYHNKNGSVTITRKIKSFGGRTETYTQSPKGFQATTSFSRPGSTSSTTSFNGKTRTRSWAKGKGWRGRIA